MVVPPDRRGSGSGQPCPSCQFQCQRRTKAASLPQTRPLLLLTSCAFLRLLPYSCMRLCAVHTRSCTYQRETACARARVRMCDCGRVSSQIKWAPCCSLRCTSCSRRGTERRTAGAPPSGRRTYTSYQRPTQVKYTPFMLAGYDISGPTFRGVGQAGGHAYVCGELAVNPPPTASRQTCSPRSQPASYGSLAFCQKPNDW